MLKKLVPLRRTHFVPEWIDKKPLLPVPKIDWIVRKKLDVPYGDDPLQKMDIYYPAQGKGPYPTVILVHGGGFAYCDKRDWHVYPGFYALQKSFALISVNYRLLPQAPFPCGVEDVKDAVGFLRKGAGELELDADNFFLYGTSAGGNLVSYAGLDGNASRGTSRDFHVNAVACLCGLINFPSFLQQAVGPARAWKKNLKVFASYLGGPPQETTEMAQKASADSRIAPHPPAFYIQHGDKDPAVSVQQSIDFHKKLQESGFLPDEDLVLHILQGAPHAGGGPEFLEAENVLPILEFFTRHRQG